MLLTCLSPRHHGWGNPRWGRAKTEVFAVAHAWAVSSENVVMKNTLR